MGVAGALYFFTSSLRPQVLRIVRFYLLFLFIGYGVFLSDMAYFVLSTTLVFSVTKSDLLRLFDALKGVEEP